MGDFILAFTNSPGFGVVLGALISIITTLIANKYTLKAKRVEKQLEVTYEVKLTQLNTLVDLQTAIQNLGRANVECCQSMLHDNLHAENGTALLTPR